MRRVNPGLAVAIAAASCGVGSMEHELAQLVPPPTLLLDPGHGKKKRGRRAMSQSKRRQRNNWSK